MKQPTVYYYIQKPGPTGDKRARVTVKVVYPDRSIFQDSTEVEYTQLKMFSQDLLGEKSEALKGILAERGR